MDVSVHWMDADGLVTPTSGVLDGDSMLVNGTSFKLFHQFETLCAFVNQDATEWLKVKLPIHMGCKLYPAPVVWYVTQDTPIDAYWTTKGNVLQEGGFLNLMDAENDAEVDSLHESSATEDSDLEESVCDDDPITSEEEESEEEAID